MCETTVPAEVVIGENHATACHLYTTAGAKVPA